MSTVDQIIDANINRALEGIRVSEEIARFVLKNEALFIRLKNLRHLIKDEAEKLDFNLYLARNIDSDVGRDKYSEGEGTRKNIENVFMSNIKRAQESARVLEEFSKLQDRNIGKCFKKIRFELYDLETIISSLVSKKSKLDFDLYVISDISNINTCIGAIDSGVRIVQLRDKAASQKKYFYAAKKMSKLCRKKNAVFIVNDYADVCLAVDADGIHLGQEDMPVHIIRKIVGHQKIIGVSTHSFSQAVSAEKDGADYISIGPIFETPSKLGWGGLGVGIIRKVLEKIQIPVVAIGGINEGNVKSVATAGIKRIAVIRAAKSVKKLRGIINAKR